MLGELAVSPVGNTVVFSFFLPVSPVRHDKNPRSRLLLKATSSTPSRDTQRLCWGRACLPHPVQAFCRTAVSDGAPGNHGPEASGAGKTPPLPPRESTPTWRLSPQAPTKAAFLWKTQEMYVRAILFVYLTLLTFPSVSGTF